MDAGAVWCPPVLKGCPIVMLSLVRNTLDYNDHINLPHKDPLWEIFPGVFQKICCPLGFSLSRTREPRWLIFCKFRKERRRRWFFLPEMELMWMATLSSTYSLLRHLARARWQSDDISSNLSQMNDCTSSWFLSIWISSNSFLSTQSLNSWLALLISSLLQLALAVTTSMERERERARKWRDIAKCSLFSLAEGFLCTYSNSIDLRHSKYINMFSILFEVSIFALRSRSEMWNFVKHDC